MMLEKPSACSGCPGKFWNQEKGFVPALGVPHLGVAFMAEAAGENEILEGEPLVPWAPAGSVLRKVLKKLGYEREQFLYTNVLSCRPPENWLSGAPWERATIEHCQIHRDKFLKPYVGNRLKVIVALGKVAMRTLTGHTEEWLCRGYPFWNSTYRCWVVPTIHPSYLARGKMNFLGVLEHDIAKAIWIAENGVAERKPLERRFILEPTRADVEAFIRRVRENSSQLLSIDIENPKQLDEAGDEENHSPAPITQIQFSLGLWEGICIPRSFPNFWTHIKELLRSSNPKIGHNWWRYDGLVLKSEGCEVRGVVHDSMVLFHHYQSNIPGCYGLQAVASFFGALHPWKHLVGSRMDLYGCYDVSEPHRIYSECKLRLEELGCWNGYLQKLRLDPILLRMRDRGLGVDSKAQSALRDYLAEEIAKGLGELTEIVRPLGLLNTKPKNGFVKEPKSTKGLVLRDFIAEVDVVQEVLIECSCKRKCKNCNSAHKRIRKVKIGKETRRVTRWCREINFTTSDDQVKRYCRHKGYPIPHHRREDRETTDEKALEELERKHGDDFFSKVLAVREIKKLKESYTGEAWTPGKDGRVHSTFGHLTATGQLTSRDPNTQQIPAQTETASLFRRCIVAERGKVLIKFDYSAFHALMTGFEARDPLYMRMARLDFHSFFTLCGMLKLMKPEKLIERSDDEIKETFKWYKAQKKEIAGFGQTFKEIRDFSGKRTVLGYGFGMEGGMLYKTYPEFFPSKKVAQSAIDSLNGLVPITAEWRNSIVREVHRLSMKNLPLVSRHGYCRWFHEAMVTCKSCHYGFTKPETTKAEAAVNRAACKRCGGEGRVFGREAKEAIAFLPANDAHGHLKEKVLELEELGLLEKGSLGGMVNYVHDDIQIEAVRSLSRGWAKRIKKVLESSSKVLIDSELAPKGLSVAVEVKWGRNLDVMEEIL